MGLQLLRHQSFLTKAKASATVQETAVSFLAEFSRPDKPLSFEKDFFSEISNLHFLQEQEQEQTLEADRHQDYLQEARETFVETSNTCSIIEYNELLENRAKLGIYDADCYEIYTMTFQPYLLEQHDSDTLYEGECMPKRKTSITSLTTLTDHHNIKPNYLLSDPKNICWSSRKGYSLSSLSSISCSSSLSSSSSDDIYQTLSDNAISASRRAKYRSPSSGFRIYSIERQMFLNSKIMHPLKNRFVEVNPRIHN